MSTQGKTFIRRRGTTPVPNSTVHDQRISYQALGILVTVLGRPARRAGNGYRAFIGRGMGQAAILTALKQLEEAGYRYQFTRREGGRMVTDTVWSEVPIDPQTAAAWHAQEIEAHESRGKTTKVRKLKTGTVREMSRTDRAEDSTHSTVRDSPRTETHAPSVPEDQGSPTRYARNGKPGISNAHEDDRGTAATHEHEMPTGKASRGAEAPEGQDVAQEAQDGPQGVERGTEAPEGQDVAQEAQDGPQGVEAWHAVKARLAQQREERRAREAAESRFGRLTEPSAHRYPRPRMEGRA